MMNKKIISGKDNLRQNINSKKEVENNESSYFSRCKKYASQRSTKPNNSKE